MGNTNIKYRNRFNEEKKNTNIYLLQLTYTIRNYIEKAQVDRKWDSLEKEWTTWEVAEAQTDDKPEDFEIIQIMIKVKTLCLESWDPR